MKLMLIVLAVIVGLLGGGFYVKHRLSHAADQGNLEAAIDREVEKFQRRNPARAVMVGVVKEGRLFSKGYGVEAPTADTVFQIASVSKLFTASLLQVLSDAGVVQLDDTLQNLIGDQVTLAPAAQSVTLRQLVTHTSGFPSIPKPLEEEALKQAGQQNILIDPYRYLGPDYIFAYLANPIDKKEAGSFEYSNYGMGLLAHVLERVTGQDYEALVSEKILLPLGMQATRLTLAPHLQDHLAPGYNELNNPTPPWTFAALAGAGGWYSTVKDLLTFMQANIEADTPLTRSLRNMHFPQTNGTTGIGWMLPLFMDKIFGNNRIVWHNGQVGGYASYLAVDPQAKQGVVLLINKGVESTLLGLLLMRQVRTQSWSEPYHKPTLLFKNKSDS